MLYLRRICPDEMEFHLKKADRSECPRRRDFNRFHRQYREEQYGGHDGSDMLECLEAKLEKEDLRFRYQSYNEETGDPLVLVFQTSFMSRVCEKVIVGLLDPSSWSSGLSDVCQSVPL